MPRRRSNSFPAVAILATLILIGYAFRFGQLTGRPAATEDGISVYFSPHGGCTSAVVQQIDAARQSIDIEAYTFTSRRIAEALVAAQHRGVAVRAVFDDKATHESSSLAGELAAQGVPTWTDAQYAIAHNKVIVIDGITVLTGSFNFTVQAEDANAENLLVITGHPKLAQAYEQNFQFHLNESQTYRSLR